MKKSLWQAGITTLNLTLVAASSWGIVGGIEPGDDTIFTKASVRFSVPDPGLDSIRAENSCTGTLITPHHLLTAYHCVHGYFDASNEKRKARYLNGITSFHGKSIEPSSLKFQKVFTPEEILAARAEEHPNTRVMYKVDIRTLIQHDLAVVKFDGDLPAVAAFADHSTSLIPEKGKMILIAGYGSESLIEDRTAQKLKYIPKFVSAFNPIQKDNLGEFLAKGVFFFSNQDGSGPSHGDSGAGVYQKLPESDSYGVVGVFSQCYPKASSPDNSCDAFGSAVTIESHREWLNKVLTE